MEFSGQYLTYEEYIGLGGTLDLTPFNLLEFEARKQIDLRTQGRLKNIDSCEIPEDVKLCDFNLIQKVDGYAKATSKISEGGNIASEKTDGYSISYVSASQIKEIVSSKQAELQDMIMAELYGVIVNGEHIIYNGVLQ